MAIFIGYTSAFDDDDIYDIEVEFYAETGPGWVELGEVRTTRVNNIEMTDDDFYARFEDSQELVAECAKNAEDVNA